MLQLVHKGLQNNPEQKVAIIMGYSASEMPEPRKVFKQKVREPLTTCWMRLVMEAEKQ